MPPFLAASPYLAALAAVDAVVEAAGLVAAHAAQHAVVTVEFWGEESQGLYTTHYCILCNAFYAYYA
jgi:hypothetical protein